MFFSSHGPWSEVEQGVCSGSNGNQTRVLPLEPLVHGIVGPRIFTPQNTDLNALDLPLNEHDDDDDDDDEEFGDDTEIVIGSLPDASCCCMSLYVPSCRVRCDCTNIV